MKTCLIFTISGSYNSYEKNLIKKIINNSNKKCPKVFNKDIFGNLQNKGTKIDFQYFNVKFDENFANEMIELLHFIISIIPNISTTSDYELQDYSIQFKGKLESIIISIIHCFSYKAKEEKTDFLDFCSILFFRICKAHALRNGNKRLSIIFLSKILSFFGFYIVWSSIHDKFVKEWEKFVIYVSEQENQNESNIIFHIKEKIIKSIWVNYNSFNPNLDFNNKDEIIKSRFNQIKKLEIDNQLKEIVDSLKDK